MTTYRSILPVSRALSNDDWNKLFDWTTDSNKLSNRMSSTPSVNIMETKDEFVIELAAPGLKREDFEIELNNEQLIIKTESSEKNEQLSEDGKYTRKEFNYAGFMRSFKLDNSIVDSDKISASYTDGVLKLTMPKREEVKEKPARKITIG